MLTTILNHNEKINNYILELNLPDSSVLKNHMINFVSGITVTEGNKNLSSTYRELTCSSYRSTGPRFLSLSMLRKREYFMLYLKFQIHQYFQIGTSSLNFSYLVHKPSYYI